MVRKPRKFHPGWLALFFAVLGILLPIVLTKACDPSAEQQCQSLVAMRAVPEAIASAQFKECMASGTVRSFMPCALKAADADTLYACAHASYVRFGSTPSRRDLEALRSTLPPAAATLTPPSTPFMPSQHGFKMPNDSTFGDGACEGLSYGAIDYFRHGIETPLIAAPAPGLRDWNDLFGWIAGRQKETVWKNWGLYVQMTWFSDDIARAQKSLDSLAVIEKPLLQGQPTLVGLFPSDNWPWNGHAVVARWYHEQVEPSRLHTFTLYIYDPNYPDLDFVWLSASVNPTQNPQLFDWTEWAWDEVPSDPPVAVDRWAGISDLTYFGPGAQVGSKILSVLSSAQISSMNGAFLSVTVGNSVAYHFVTHAMEFPLTYPEYEAIGGTWEDTISISRRRHDLFCDLVHPASAHCRPPDDLVLTELHSGKTAHVFPDGTYCGSKDLGIEVPAGAIASPRFVPAATCGGGDVPPQPDGGVPTPTGHRIAVYFADVDDDAYVWIGRPSASADAACHARIGENGGGGYCDISDKVKGNQTMLVFKIGNGGCYGSKGTLGIKIDDEVAWEGHEYDNGWKHCGWTYRAYVPVDEVNGRVDTQNVRVDSCYNVGDCDD